MSSSTAAMDNQHTLPFATVEEVRQEVMDNLRILGAGGDISSAPRHNTPRPGVFDTDPCPAYTPERIMVTDLERCRDGRVGRQDVSLIRNHS